MIFNVGRKSGGTAEYNSYYNKSWISGSSASTLSRKYSFTIKANTKYELLCETIYSSGPYSYAYGQHINPVLKVNGVTISATDTPSSGNSYIQGKDSYNAQFQKFLWVLEGYSEGDTVELTCGWTRWDDGTASARYGSEVDSVAFTSFGASDTFSNITVTN